MVADPLKVGQHLDKEHADVGGAEVLLHAGDMLVLVLLDEIVYLLLAAGDLVICLVGGVLDAFMRQLGYPDDLLEERVQILLHMPSY